MQCVESIEVVDISYIFLVNKNVCDSFQLIQKKNIITCALHKKKILTNLRHLSIFPLPQSVHPVPVDFERRPKHLWWPVLLRQAVLLRSAVFVEAQHQPHPYNPFDRARVRSFHKLYEQYHRHPEISFIQKPMANTTYFKTYLSNNMKSIRYALADVLWWIYSLPFSLSIATNSTYRRAR